MADPRFCQGGKFIITSKKTRSPRAFTACNSSTRIINILNSVLKVGLKHNSFNFK